MENSIDYQLNYTSKDFDKTLPWSFTIEDAKVNWSTAAPFLQSDGFDDSDLVVEELNKFINRIWEDKDNLFKFPVSSILLYKHASAPYTVLYAIASIYGVDPELVKFSENAPKWSDFDPEDEEDTDDSTIVETIY